VIASETTSRSGFDRFAASYRSLHDASVAFSGETGAYFAEYKAKWLARALSEGGPKRVLDYGCGIGLVCAHLRKYLPSAQIDGFDPSLASLDQLDGEVRRHGFFTSDVCDLGANYDAVLLANVLHHVEPKDRQSAVLTATSLLRSGGKLIIFEHNPANPLTRRAVDRCPFDENVILLRPQESADYAVRSGLVRVTRKYVVFFPHALQWLRPLERNLGWLPVGAQYVVAGIRQ
jgi:SAM-dependent methyltransferase